MFAGIFPTSTDLGSPQNVTAPGPDPIHLVLPEGCLDKPGGFVELPLLVVRQSQLSKLVLHLLAGGRAQELRPVRCGGEAGSLESDFAAWRASGAQAGVRRGGQRLAVCTSETGGDTGERLVVDGMTQLTPV